MRVLRIFALTVLASISAHASAHPEMNLVLRWNSAALQGVRESNLGAPMASRALAIVHTCMYDAWAAYDERAVGTQLSGALRRPNDAGLQRGDIITEVNRHPVHSA